MEAQPTAPPIRQQSPEPGLLLNLSPEIELRAAWATREEEFARGGVRLRLLLPRAAEALIDEAAFEADERLPYWADLWPSARALALHLLDAPSVTGLALELGCGAAALPSLALRARGAEVTASDYEPNALRFAAANAERNGLAPLPTRELDWRQVPAGLGPFECVVAADVVYERRNAEALAAALPGLVAPGGRFLLADPGRAYLGELRARMRAVGWTVREVGTRMEQAAEGAPPVRVRITEWRRGTDPQREPPKE